VFTSKAEFDRERDAQVRPLAITSYVLWGVGGAALVAGGVLLSEVTEDAAALPIKIPVDGMVIETAAGPNAVKWGGDVALLDLNGKDRVVVRDVALTYTTTTPAPDSQARVAIVNTGGVSDGCTLSNVERNRFAVAGYS
jgi:hypothetical protein